MEDFWTGFKISIIIPIVVSYPITLVMIRYHKKINKQKEELERLDSINKKLFAIIAHDIRSPIASLKGITDMLVSKDIDPDEGKHYYKSISLKIDGLLEFLNNLLSWSKMQIENKELELSTFQSYDVIKPILDLYEELREAKGVILSKGDLNTSIYADKDSYALIIRNLLHNAIKFTDKDHKVSISTEEVDNKVHTTIEDCGIGMTKDQIDNIINNKAWLSTAGTSEEIGTGLGLQTCIQYLNKQNGKLLINSELGKGTKVTVVLPKTDTSYA
jgi:signal transduction histidine kinase